MMGGTSLPASLWQRFGAQFVRFFVVGIGATVVHCAVYIGLNSIFGITQEDVVAYNITFALGYAISFIGNYIVSLKWTFKTKGSGKKGAGFALSHVINWAMQTSLLNLMIKLGVGAWLSGLVTWLMPWLVESCPRLGDPTTLAILPVYCIVVPTNFLLVRFFLTHGDKQ